MRAGPTSLPLRGRRQAARLGISLAVGLALLLACALIHLGLGARYIAPRELLRALLFYDAHNFDHQVIVQLRLARLLAAILAGAALGTAGALLQSVIRNPLGEPHILGLNAGAALAVVAASALGGVWADGPVSRPLVAGAGAAALFAVVLALSSSGRSGLTPLKVTLCGVALSSCAAAMTAAILILDEQTLMELRTWLAGDLAGVAYVTLQGALTPALTGLLLALFISPRLNILALGDSAAVGLGVNITRTRLLALAAAALLCGAAVATAGPIGFIGLVAPHIVRRLVSDDIRLVTPLSALAGAVLLLAADIAARTLIAPRELATGVMTALLGAPVFIAIAARRLA